MTQEFHISVTLVGQNDYLVRTEQVASGVPLAEELVTWPVADWLAAAGHLMNDPLKSVLQGDAMVRNSVNLAALGQQLYNELFQGTLRDSWITAQGIAQNHQQVLHLRIGIKDNRLARLPWEVMQAGDRPVATGPYISFSRYQTGVAGASRLPSMNMPIPPDEGGIKVLMVLASPTDLVRLDLLKQEAIKLQAELHRQAPNITEGGHFFPDIQLHFLEQPGREELTQALEQGRYHILHYSGHSNLGANGGEIYLVNRRTGLTETLTGDDLAGLLVNNNIQMAVFNSCLGAYGASGGNGETGEQSLTESLVKRGIRSVLAMSERIPDEVALTLTQLFYRNLIMGYPIDLCVSRVRQGLISAYGSHQMYWALPILYLHSEFDGNLSPGLYLPQRTELLPEYSPSIRATNALYTGMGDDAQMSLPIDDVMSGSLGQDDLELDWLGEETWGDLVDEIEDYDDPSYADDSAIVSDLFRQLDQQKAVESSISDSLIDPEETIPGLEVSDDLSSVDRQVEKWRRDRSARDSESIVSRASNQTSLQGREMLGSTNASNSTITTSPHDLVSIKEQGVKRRKSKLIPLVGLVGAGAIAFAVGINWWHQPNVLNNLPQVTVPDYSKINLDKEKTEKVTAFATEKINQGDLNTGLKAIEALLNRNALPEAETVLKLIPQQNIDNPSVTFLFGRLAWQSIQVGNKKYSIDDARRYWQTAVKAKPDSIVYTNALGFAYYAEGDINRANDSWFQALSIATKAQQPTALNMSANASVQPTQRQDLMAYAGLALGLYKSAQQQPPAKREQYLSEAVKLRQKVISEDPRSFQVDKLNQNWLWTEKITQDWKSLLKIPSQRR
ncbi:heterocyst differentiation protein [Calothrix sp. NIES-4071]|nr:heterocyst differentiation protein [Calothrix sp. NIES-4071]BAZ62759.1 heterocyst differentiation protein [Calothrix sp. NIES-4105]